jgi:chromosome segregation ATPase
MWHESQGWIGRRIRAALQGEIDALRADIAESRAQTELLRTAMQSLAEDMGSRVARAETDLAALREAMDRQAGQTQTELSALREALDKHGTDGTERTEALRLRVEGLIAQHRWDSDQLRQAVAAIAERLPFTD